MESTADDTNMASPTPSDEQMFAGPIEYDLQEQGPAPAIAPAQASTAQTGISKLLLMLAGIFHVAPDLARRIADHTEQPMDASSSLQQTRELVTMLEAAIPEVQEKLSNLQGVAEEASSAKDREIASLNDDLTEYLLDNTLLKAELGPLRDEVNQLGAAVECEKSRVQAGDRRVSELESEAERNGQLIRDLQAQVDNGNQRIGELSSERPLALQELQAKSATDQNSIQVQGSAATQSEETRNPDGPKDSDIAELQTRNARLDQEISRLEREAAAHEERIADLEQTQIQQVTTLQSTIETRDATIRQLREDLRQLHSDQIHDHIIEHGFLGQLWPE